MNERRFFFLCVIAIVTIRLAVIFAMPRGADFNDPRIYQATGQMVLAGINPYDFSDQPALRNTLRKRAAWVPAEDVTSNMDNWNYYVSGNLPASTALYAVFAFIAQGSRFIWRLLFIIGDLAIFAGLCALVRAVRGSVRDIADQVAIAFLSVINPVLIVEGCASPEDKQFQTALMLFSAALLLSPKASKSRLAEIGAVLSLSVLFKMFGLFLFPMWLVRAVKNWPRFALWTTLGAIVPAVISFAVFGFDFIETMGARTSRDSFGQAAHASPWVLLPWLGGETFLVVKFAVVSLCVIGIVASLAYRQIDLLNFCASLALVFGCLWLDKGSVDRLNIVMMFAMASFVTISVELFFSFSVITALVSGLAYVIGVGLFKTHPEPIEAGLSAAFLFAYLAALIGLWFGVRPIRLRSLCRPLRSRLVIS